MTEHRREFRGDVPIEPAAPEGDTPGNDPHAYAPTAPIPATPAGDSRDRLAGGGVGGTAGEDAEPQNDGIAEHPVGQDAVDGAAQDMLDIERSTRA